MRRVALVVLGTAGLLLSACATPSPVTSDAPVVGSGALTESGASVSGSGTFHKAANVFYRDYMEGDIGNGTPAVLFFEQSADVFSQRSDRLLQHLYGSGAATISTYRLDAGTASGMKLKFTVLLADTFVVVNGSGAKVSSILHPNANELTKLVVR